MTDVTTDIPISDLNSASKAIEGLLGDMEEDPSPAHEEEKGRAVKPAPDVEDPEGDDADENADLEAQNDLQEADEGDDAETAEADGEEEEGEDKKFKPPSSWDADEKKGFDGLTPAMQEVISRRDGERETAFQNGKQSLKEARSAHETEVVGATEELGKRYALLEQIFGSIEETFFNGVARGTEADLEADATDYMRKNARFEARKGQWDKLQSEIGKLRGQMAEQSQTQLRAQHSREWEKRKELWPEWADEKKRRTITSELNAYLGDKGFNPEEMRDLLDHRMFMVLRDALAFKKTTKLGKSIAKKIAKVPKVRKPGVQRSAKETTRDKRTRLSNRLRKSGNRQDGVGLVYDILGD